MTGRGDGICQIYSAKITKVMVAVRYLVSTWKILHRQVVVDWIKRHPVVDERDSDAFDALAKGARQDSDPLYSFLQAGEAQV